MSRPDDRAASAAPAARVHPDHGPFPSGRVVVYRLGRLGDTVVALPCLHAVARAFPGAERILLTNLPVSSKAAPMETILSGSGLLHRFIAYPVGTRSFEALRDLRASLRSRDARTLVYLTPARGLLSVWRDLLFFRLCGFRTIVGAPATRSREQIARGAAGVIDRECAELAASRRSEPPTWTTPARGTST